MSSFGHDNPLDPRNHALDQNQNGYYHPPADQQQHYPHPPSSSAHPQYPYSPSHSPYPHTQDSHFPYNSPGYPVYPQPHIRDGQAIPPPIGYHHAQPSNPPSFYPAQVPYGQQLAYLPQQAYSDQSYPQPPHSLYSPLPQQAGPSPAVPSPSPVSHIPTPSTSHSHRPTHTPELPAQLFPSIAVEPPSDQPKPASTTTSVRPIKLVIRRSAAAAPSTSEPEPVNNSKMPASRRSSSSQVKAEGDLYTPAGRPMRASRIQAQRSFPLYRETDDDSEEEERHNLHEETSSKPARQTRASARSGEVDADAFEDRMMTSPVVPDSHEKRKTRGRKMDVKQFEITHEESGEDDYADGSPGPRRSKILPFPPRSGRLAAAINGDHKGGGEDEDGDHVEEPDQSQQRSTRSGGRKQKSRHASADDEEDWSPGKEASASATESEQAHSDPIIDDEEEESDDSYGGYRSPRRRLRPKPKPAPTRATRATRRSTRSTVRAARSPSEGSDGMPKKRELRERTKAVNYRLPPPDITLELEARELEEVTGPSGPGGGFGSGPGRKKTSHFTGTLPWLVKTAQRPNMSMGDDDSDSDLELLGMKGTASGMPSASAGASGGQAAIGGVGAMKTDVPNFGRVNPKSNLADADPLGVDMNVTFDNVGGLDNHINQLKEMVALPLLYPEIYQQFGVTPPRGVLFHGPPGTGKTLLARALAASCSNGNTKIAFFMRKGADVLSKWVGEAERQLRMLFEEARNAQPSIIFFDEIDGLAPVRSSKQDQIHASLVSTLLALMDGMDGRGQVIVIGATNRPDAVDPALRRPGRFDREFYFPLPNKEARKKIIGINTRKWSPGVSDEMLDQLAGMTKGYGGADLRSLCTEAALNAVQRRYPQIYSSSDRLLLDPSSIKVGAKDFMMSVKKIIPSSARSASSAAAPLPAHLVPILEEPLDRLKQAVDKVLPRHQTKTALEEAQYEDEVGDDLEQHALVHSLDRMRTFRPRILVHGPPGMGQTYLGPAVLHHLEGFHVQSLDLGALMGDSTSTIEASLVQLFVEAKRHQPAVLFIPSLLPWCLALTETARTTFRSLLDSVPSSDAVLLLAIMDGSIQDLPRDVRRWFGIGKEGRVELTSPNSEARAIYFSSLVDTFRKPPTAFPDALPRRKRVLEILPVAPPIPPREPTQEEIEREEKDLLHTRNVLHWSFAGLWPDIPKKFDRYVRAAQDGAKAMHKLWLDSIADAKARQADVEAQREALEATQPASLPNGTTSALHGETHEPEVALSASAPAILPTSTEEVIVASAPVAEAPPASIVDLFAANSPVAPPPVDLPEPEVAPSNSLVDVEIPPEPTWEPYTIDFDIIQTRLNSHKYFTPQDFKDDIDKILANAEHSQNPMLITKLKELHTVIENHIRDFDHATWGPKFERYKAKMLERKAKRAEQKRLEREGREGEGQGDTASGASAPAELADSHSLKRSREEDDEERAGKRQKSQEMDVDPQPVSTSLQPPTTNPLTIPSVPSPAPSPAPGHPPFICPEADLAALSSELKEKTARLNVDLLEQLRAGCYDKIWRARGEWDRTNVIAETRRWVGEFMEEVEEMEGESE